jgi:uncharacterized iron-regulated membrane protein
MSSPARAGSPVASSPQVAGSYGINRAAYGWLRQPQSLWVRRALFQIHLWTGVATGFYVLVICLTGSLLVYSNELYFAAMPKPILVAAVGTRLTDAEIEAAAVRAHPGYEVARMSHPRNPRRTVEVRLTRGAEVLERLFDPYTGVDVGPGGPGRIRIVSWLVSLHDNLLGGRTGRKINGFGGFCVALLGVTGLVIWWPGTQRWRRSLTLHRRVGWRRLMWDVHSALGIWTFVFVLMFGITGAYLGYPRPFHLAGDFLEPSTDANWGNRVVDSVTYWLAYLHFGRFGGRVPGCARTCNSIFKAVWALFGLAPLALFVTGAAMWWNRVLRRATLDPVNREGIKAAPEFAVPATAADLAPPPLA